jgi:hypothetical protein
VWYDSHGVYGMHIMGVVPKMDGIHIICTEVLVFSSYLIGTA